jgi:hypothetical protein
MAKSNHNEIKPIPQLTDADIARFRAKVSKAGPDDCWLWKAYTDECGYGIFGVGRKIFRAHRIARKLGGPLDDSLEVLHTCDNPPCCNPAHLFQGTQQDNIADMVRKGRQSCGRGPRKPEWYQRGNAHWTHKHPERLTRGERHANSKLMDAQIRDIRKRASAGELHRVIALDYAVSRSLVGAICRGEVWSHVT